MIVLKLNEYDDDDDDDYNNNLFYSSIGSTTNCPNFLSPALTLLLRIQPGFKRCLTAT
jgi:hypothetical protein